MNSDLRQKKGHIQKAKMIFDSSANLSEEHKRTEKKILRTSFLGCIGFLAAEIIIAVITGSQAIFVDCLWDGVNIAMVVPMMILVPLLSQGVTAKRPFGFYPVESLLVVIKCGILSALCILLIVDNIQLIREGGHHIDAGILAIFELAVCVCCILIYLCLKRMEKGYETPIIAAEVYIWKMDALSTLGVSAGFAVQLILERTKAAFLAPYVDPVIATIIAISLLKEPLSMLMDSLRSLTLCAPKKEVVDEVKAVISEKLTDTPFTNSFLEVVKTGRKLWISVYVLPNRDEMSFEEIKKIGKNIKGDLIQDFEEIYVEIIPDTEAGESGK